MTVAIITQIVSMARKKGAISSVDAGQNPRIFAAARPRVAFRAHVGARRRRYAEPLRLKGRTGQGRKPRSGRAQARALTRSTAQIRTGPIRAYGSHLGCRTAKRCCGQGWRIFAWGSQASVKRVIRSQVMSPFWLRRRVGMRTGTSPMGGLRAFRRDPCRLGVRPERAFQNPLDRPPPTLGDIYCSVREGASHRVAWPGSGLDTLPGAGSVPFILLPPQQLLRLMPKN